MELRKRARRAHVRGAGAAELRDGAGDGARRARPALAQRRAAAQRVQAAHAPLGLGRGRLVLAAPPRALPAGRARAARLARYPRVHLLTCRGLHVCICVDRPSSSRRSASAGDYPNSSIYKVLEILIFNSLKFYSLIYITVKVIEVYNSARRLVCARIFT